VRSGAVLALVVALAALTGCGGAAVPSPSPSAVGQAAWTRLASGKTAPPGLNGACSSETWYSVTAPDAAHAFMVGMNGVIYATADAGASWHPQQAASIGTAATNSAQVFAIDARHVWGVGANGRIVATSDGGATWTDQESPAKSLIGVAFCDPDNGWAVGGRDVVHTADGGRTWTAQSAPLGTLREHDGLTAVACVDPERAWVVRQHLVVGGKDTVSSVATVYGTSDGGTSWRRLWSGDAGGQHIEFVDQQHGWLAGGGVWATSDGGATWRRQSGAGTWISDIAFVDAKHGWVSDFDAKHRPAILRTVDGGQTWERQTLKSLGLADGRRADAWGIAFSDVSHGWAVGSTGDFWQMVGRYAPP
jgi:photosystem II stability/assembly factor-like uncharacterized protein